jgi:tRNA(Ile)-lysidine synthase
LHIPWLVGRSRAKRYLVGVSGGADSVAMLHWLVEAGFHNLVVCHLDHRLRGRASTDDAKFVQLLAARLGLKCEIDRVDVRARMTECGESMETAARNARHGFFAECARKHRCRRVLLAHHADDQAETVLWNLLRGSHGLKGMRMEQTMRVQGIELGLIRPLLGLRHSQLLAWLESRGHRWREDASNHEPVAVRNRLRNEVFSLLDSISQRDSVMAFARAAADAAMREDAENAALQEAALIDPQGRLHLPALRKLPPSLQRAALRNYLIDQQVPSINRALIEISVMLLDPASAAVVNLPGGRRLRRRAGRLWVES